MDNTNQQKPDVNYKEETTKMLKEKLAYFLIGLSAIVIVIAGSLLFLHTTKKGSSSNILNNVLGNNSQPTISEQIAEKEKAEMEAENKKKDIVERERGIAIIRGIKPTLTVKDIAMVSATTTPVVDKPTATKGPTPTVAPTATFKPSATAKPSATKTPNPTRKLTVTKAPTATPVADKPTATKAPTATAKPTATVKPTNTVTPSKKPTATATAAVAVKPSAVPSVIVTPKGQAKTYTVQSGDYLWQIAEKFYGDGFKAYDIAKANNITTPSQIYRGTVLKLPALKSTVAPTMAQSQITNQPEQGQIGTGAQTGKVTFTGNIYTVKGGDSLWSIAEAAYGDGYSWTRIAKANNIVNPGLIFSGTKLTIPRN